MHIVPNRPLAAPDKSFRFERFDYAGRRHPAFFERQRHPSVGVDIAPPCPVDIFLSPAPRQYIEGDTVAVKRTRCAVADFPPVVAVHARQFIDEALHGSIGFCALPDFVFDACKRCKNPFMCIRIFSEKRHALYVRFGRLPCRAVINRIEKIGRCTRLFCAVFRRRKIAQAAYILFGKFRRVGYFFCVGVEERPV